MKVKEIKYFRPDGKDIKPGGVFYAKGMMYNEISKNVKSFMHSTLNESFLTEKVSDKQYGFEKYKGGMIVFATSVNTVVDETEKSKIKAFLKKIYYSIVNYTKKDGKIDKIIKKLNKEFEGSEDMFIGAFSLGHFFKGKYVTDTGIYNDKSTSIEIGGIPSEMLLFFAIALCKEFKQDTVLVKDFNKDKIFLVDSEGIEGDSSKDKILNAREELKKVKNLNKQ